MTLDQFIALAASVAACASALATFMTIRQMAKQREASYRPELVFAFTPFEGLASAKGRLPENWESGAREEKEASHRQRLKIPLHNVGLGAARSVKLTWSFPIERATQEANERAQRALIPAYFTYDDGALSLKSETLGTGTSFWSNQRSVSLDFVLPASVEAEPLTLSLPLAYIELCSALLYFAMNTQGDPNFPDFPALQATLEFLDIGGTKHEAQYEFSILLGSVTNNAESFTAAVQVKKGA